MAKRKRDDVTDINYDRISAMQHPDKKAEIIHEEIERVKVPCLTDAYVWRKEGGQKILEALDRRKGASNRPKWKLNVLCLQNGNRPKPGDEISYISERTNRNLAGKKVSANMIAEMKQKGRGSHFDTVSKFIVDQNLQIECEYMDALHLLTQFGVSYKDGHPICNKEATSNDGKVHNHRYSEVVEFEDDEPKRGK